MAEGFSYEEIARQVGFTNRGSAHRAVRKALAERQAEDIDTLRALEADRLDALQAAHWDLAMAGDPGATNSILRVMERRARLFGLDKDQASDSESRVRLLVQPSAQGNPGQATSHR